MVRTSLLIITVVYAVVLVTTTHIPPAHLPSTGVSDKLEHVVGYGVLGVLVSLTTAAFARRVPFVAIVVGLLAFAFLDEATQPLVGRTADVWDWVADACGATLATAAVWLGNAARNVGCDGDACARPPSPRDDGPA